nr:MAG TPA: YopX protein [Caudoviricetes sp.]
MREIKFRGLNIADDEWIYGSLVKVGENYHILGGGETEAHDYNSVDEESIGQYTGLKDKNGREVYEGDMFKFINGDIMYVKWVKEYVEFELMDANAETTNLNIWFAEDTEVIGNIFENKELLETRD